MGTGRQYGMRSIVMMYRIEIDNLIYRQMMQHFYCENGFIQEEVSDESKGNLKLSYTHRTTCDLFDDDYQGDICYRHQTRCIQRSES